MIALREALGDYLGIRRRLGFEMPQDSALREYARQRDARFPMLPTPAFFIAARGGRLSRSELSCV